MKKTLIIAVALGFSVASLAFSQDAETRGQRRQAGGGFFAAARTEDGKIDLSKLPEQMPQQRKDALKAADKDGDGFLNSEELSAVMPARNGRQEGATNRFQGAPQGQQGPRFGAPGTGVGPFGAPGMMTDGKLDLSKLPEQMPQERKDALKAADKNGDGFVDFEEMREAMPARGDRPQGQFGAGPVGPRMGFGPFGAPGMTTDGKLDLSKLPEQMPQERKDAWKAADKDGDGFLTSEEMRDVPRPKFQFPEGKKPEFVDNDNGLVIEKITDALKYFDKNNDGIVSAEEQKEMSEAIQREFGPSFMMFIRNVVGGPQGVGPGMGFGYGPGVGPGLGAGRAQGAGPGMGPGRTQGMGPGMGVGRAQGGRTQGMGPGMGPGRAQGGRSQGMGPGMGAGRAQGGRTQGMGAGRGQGNRGANR